MEHFLEIIAPKSDIGYINPNKIMISITNASELTYQRLNLAKPLPSRICSIKTPVKCKTFVYDLMIE